MTWVHITEPVERERLRLAAIERMLDDIGDCPCDGYDFVPGDCPMHDPNTWQARAWVADR